MATTPNPYQTVLDDLVARRAKLDAAISAIRETMMGSAGTPPTPTPAHTNGSGLAGGTTTPRRKDEFSEMTVLDAAKQFLATSNRAQSAREIADALLDGGYPFTTDNPLNTVGASLYRSEGKSGVVRVSKGLWGIDHLRPETGGGNKR